MTISNGKGVVFQDFDEFMAEIKAEREAYQKLPRWRKVLHWISSPEKCWRQLQAYHHQFIYWLRSHTTHRYHLLDMRRSPYYKWGWLDSDYKILFASFAILKDFVEKEEGLERLEYQPIAAREEADKETEAKARRPWLARARKTQEVADKVRMLYDWWMIRYPMMEAKSIDMSFDDEAWEKEQTERLLQLVRVRKYLWT